MVLGLKGLMRQMKWLPLQNSGDNLHKRPSSSCDLLGVM